MPFDRSRDNGFGSIEHDIQTFYGDTFEYEFPFDAKLGEGESALFSMSIFERGYDGLDPLPVLKEKISQELGELVYDGKVIRIRKDIRKSLYPGRYNYIVLFMLLDAYESVKLTKTIRYGRFNIISQFFTEFAWID
jgi:hypothetical protein